MRPWPRAPSLGFQDISATAPGKPTGDALADWHGKRPVTVRLQTKGSPDRGKRGTRCAVRPWAASPSWEGYFYDATARGNSRVPLAAYWPGFAQPHSGLGTGKKRAANGGNC